MNRSRASEQLIFFFYFLEQTVVSTLALDNLAISLQATVLSRQAIALSGLMFEKLSRVTRVAPVGLMMALDVILAETVVSESKASRATAPTTLRNLDLAYSSACLLASRLEPFDLWVFYVHHCRILLLQGPHDLGTVIC